jgi:hypothetical protein
MAELPRTFSGALRLVCYACRALQWRVIKLYKGEYRAKNFPEELTGALRGEYRAGMSPVAWFGSLCDRWDVSAAGGDGQWSISVQLPEGWVRWHEAMGCVRRTHLERIVEDYAGLVATFASTPPSESEADLFAAIEEPDEVPVPWRPELPASLVLPGWWWSVWTSTTPMQHGADEKSGNVSRFRVEPLTDLLTGRDVDVPLLSGNAIRGQLRDLLAAGITDAHLALGDGLVASWPNNRRVPPFVRIDHLLATDEIVPIAASTDASAVAGADVVLFCVKSTDSAATAREIAPHLGERSVVLSLQNGVENAEIIAPCRRSASPIWSLMFFL